MAEQLWTPKTSVYNSFEEHHSLSTSQIQHGQCGSKDNSAYVP